MKTYLQGTSYFYSGSIWGSWGSLISYLTSRARKRQDNFIYTVSITNPIGVFCSNIRGALSWALLIRCLGNAPYAPYYLKSWSFQLDWTSRFNAFRMRRLGADCANGKNQVMRAHGRAHTCCARIKRCIAFYKQEFLRPHDFSLFG